QDKIIRQPAKFTQRVRTTYQEVLVLLLGIDPRQPAQHVAYVGVRAKSRPPPDVPRYVHRNILNSPGATHVVILSKAKDLWHFALDSAFALSGAHPSLGGPPVACPERSRTVIVQRVGNLAHRATRLCSRP